MSQPAPPAIALLACEVFQSEIALAAAGATHIVARRMFEIGLHDRPGQMRENLQDAVTEMDARDDITAIVLAYGLCGCGTAGLRAARHPLVIPRAHDCITVFLGSRELYAKRQQSCPGCYHYTPGWNRARRVPGPERAEALRERFSQQFPPDDVDFLLDSERMMWQSYHTATYIDTGTPESAVEADYTRRCADWLGWEFEQLRGDPALLHDLLWGPWDDQRFQIIQPGQQIGHSPDEAVMCAKPVS